jgi:hypothetical protein
MKIKKATKKDVKELSEYMLKELENPNEAFPQMMIEKFRENARIENMKKQFDNPDLIGFVLLEEGKLQGFIVGYKENEGQSMIHYITAKKPGMRKFLLDSFVKESKEKGLEKVRADSFDFMDSNQFFIDSKFTFTGKGELAPGLEMLWYEIKI